MPIAQCLSCWGRGVGHWTSALCSAPHQIANVIWWGYVSTPSLSVPCYQWPGFGLEAKFYGLGLKTCGLGIEGPGLESCTDNYTSRERKIIDDSHNNKLVIIYVQLIINAYLRKSSQNLVHYSSCQDICISSVLQWPCAGRPRPRPRDLWPWPWPWRWGLDLWPWPWPWRWGLTPWS